MATQRTGRSRQRRILTRASDSDLACRSLSLRFRGEFEKEKDLGEGFRDATCGVVDGNGVKAHGMWIP
jgi:hypothetical protein